VLDLIRRVRRRVFPVGRLDYATAGAVLLTNDGELAHGLLRPRNLVPRVYRVKVKGAVSDGHLARLVQGVDAGGRTYRAARAYRLDANADNTWLSVTMHHGPADPVARMFEALDLRVTRLTRVAFADVSVEGMSPGDYRQVDKQELAMLRKYARLLHPRTRTAAPPPGWEETPPEEVRGEEDDGLWAAWEEGSVWEFFEQPETPAADAPLADGVVRRTRGEPEPGRRSPNPAPVTPEGEDRAPRHGRMSGDFDDDGWGERTRPPREGDRGPRPPRDPRREAPGRRPHAFGSGTRHGPSRDERPRGRPFERPSRDGSRPQGPRTRPPGGRPSGRQNSRGR
jgi:23S rRNA pseudouridine2605 synthase